MTVDVLRSGALDGVAHGFLGRRGGVSTGVVAGLNTGLGSGDDPAAIAENRARVVDAVLPGAALCGLYQVHSASVVRVLTAFPDGERPQGDAMVTERPNILLGILTADCAPVLLNRKVRGITFFRTLFFGLALGRPAARPRVGFVVIYSFPHLLK